MLYILTTNVFPINEWGPVRASFMLNSRVVATLPCPSLSMFPKSPTCLQIWEDFCVLIYWSRLYCIVRVLWYGKLELQEKVISGKGLFLYLMKRDCDYIVKDWEHFYDAVLYFIHGLYIFIHFMPYFYIFCKYFNASQITIGVNFTFIESWTHPMLTYRKGYFEQSELFMSF